MIGSCVWIALQAEAEAAAVAASQAIRYIDSEVFLHLLSYSGQRLLLFLISNECVLHYRYDQYCLRWGCASGKPLAPSSLPFSALALQEEVAGASLYSQS